MNEPGRLLKGPKSSLAKKIDAGDVASPLVSSLGAKDPFVGACDDLGGSSN